MLNFTVPTENLTYSYVFVTVDGGQRAVIFDRLRGVQDEVVGEGTHFLIPWVQRPIIFDIRSKPRNIPTFTGSKGLFIFSPHIIFSSHKIRKKPEILKQNFKAGKVGKSYE